MPPKIDNSREEAAAREVGATVISRRLQKFVVGAFLFTVLSVPLVQIAIEFSAMEWPRCFQIVRAIPNVGKVIGESSSLVSGIAAANESLKKDFKNYEKALEEESFLMRSALPMVQDWALRYLGLGNEKVYPGREGGLFYRPDVDYVAGPGFLNPTELRHRPNSANPLPALLRFRDDLAARGIRLILVPVPLKPVVDPEFLADSIPSRPLQNPSFDDFLEQLGKNGIEFVDASQAILDEKRLTGRPQFLKTDSHWTPSAMERVARQVAEKISLPNDSRTWKRGKPQSVRNHGDLVAMLRLSDPAALFPLEEALITPVVGPDAAAWVPDPAAEILLLGDSFTNIYSLQDLGWGCSAGFAEHLSLALQKPLDRIAINAGGAFTTRQTLARSPERLEGKKMVIYEFAMRDLAGGDWKVLPLPESKPVVEKQSPSRNGLVGTIKDITRAPKPGAVPYKDLIVCIHLTEIEGGSPTEALVFLHGMKNNIPTAASSLNTGDRIRIQSAPWSSVEDKYGAFNRKEINGPAAELEDVFWSEEIPESEQ